MRHYMCIECNRSDAAESVVITDGISWRGRDWWRDGGHMQSGDPWIEWENDVECADIEATMTTVAISADNLMSVVPIGMTHDGVPVLVVNTATEAMVYAGDVMVQSFTNEPDAEAYAIKVTECS